MKDIVHHHLDKVMEQEGILDEGTIAYRKSRGILDSMILLALMMEECRIIQKLVVIASEDDEKFFNSVPETVQVGIM